MRDNSMLQDHIVKKLNELENKSYTIVGNITKINLFYKYFLISFIETNIKYPNPFNFDFSFCGNSSSTAGLCFKRICK